MSIYLMYIIEVILLSLNVILYPFIIIRSIKVDKMTILHKLTILYFVSFLVNLFALLTVIQDVLLH